MKKSISTIISISCCVFLLNTLTGWMNKPGNITSSEIVKSVTKSLQALQKSGYSFTMHSKEKCAACHHTTLTSMAVELAKQKGVQVVDTFAVHRVRAMENDLTAVGNPNHVDHFLNVNFGWPYILLGLAAEKYPANFYTDLSVDYMMSQARAEGGFLTESGRVPLETGEMHLAAFSIRAIQLYAAPAKKKQVEALVAKTRTWLEKSETAIQQELAFQLLGMHWCGSNDDMKAKVAKKLISIQGPDGGWSQLPTLKSDAYATGQALYALCESGMIKTTDEVYTKAVAFLMKTQDETGAWIVETRAYPIQPFVNSDFPPYDENQFISAAATNWAVMALLLSLPDKS
jgi:Prenyltransferase and squalene oxidase repeat